MFTKEDLIKYKGFQAIFNKCSLNIDGNAVVTAANLKIWFDDLEKKISQDIAAQEALSSAKDPTKLSKCKKDK